VTVEVGGAGSVGFAFESTLGTYVAPTKWIPIRSETLANPEDKVYRTNIRGVADRSGAIQGYVHVEGDIVFEVSSDILPYFMYAARVVPVKSGAGPWTYTFTPAHVAKATTAGGTTTRKTLSILTQRGGNPMAYTGCSVGQLSLTVEGGVLVCTASMVGVNEAAQSPATPAWPTNAPFGPGKVTLEIPTSTVRGDADTFTLVINDNLVAANRLNGQRFAAYQNWGEREVTLSVETDFDVLTDFNAFVAQTLQAITLKAIGTPSSDELSIVLNAGVTDSYVVNLSSLGDVNRGVINYHGIYNTGDAYTVVCKTTENIT